MKRDLHPFFAEHRVILAPLAGVSDEAMRQLCVEQGADLTYSEMVSAKGLAYANDKTRQLLALAPNEKAIAVQLFGHEPDNLAAQAAAVEDQLGEHLAYIDINMGCPARKIVGKGDGSALMGTPALAADIVSSIDRTVSCPVTVKFRRGIREGEDLSLEFGRRLEQAGASAIALHGRFVQQFYRGRSDRACIARLAAAVSIPVVGNGDVACGDDALGMMRETGCAAVMVGRAAQGNPWVFADIKAAFAGTTFTPPDVEEKMAMAKRHARLLSERTGRNIVRMRKHAMWYLAGMPNASEFRGRCNAAVYLEDFNELFDEVIRRAARPL